MRTHLIIPDLQVKPGIALDHLRWIGQYVVDRKPDVVINIGDMADMESLSSYDKGKKSFEGRRVKADIDIVHEANDTLWSPLYNDKHWNDCELIITVGNHEYRIVRATESSAEFDGLVSVKDLGYSDWYDKVVPFLKIIERDGVSYSHYFYNPKTGRPWGGNAHYKLSKVGFSFTMGHVQGKDLASVDLANGTTRYGCVAGSCYMHEEDYIGPQAQNHWKGLIVKHEVNNGEYDVMTVSLEYLCRKYEGTGIKAFLKDTYGRTDGYI